MLYNLIIVSNTSNGHYWLNTWCLHKKIVNLLEIGKSVEIYWYNKVLSCQSLVKTPKREHVCCGSYDVSKRQATQHQLQKKLRAILRKNIYTCNSTTTYLWKQKPQRFIDRLVVDTGYWKRVRNFCTKNPSARCSNVITSCNLCTGSHVILWCYRRTEVNLSL